MLRNIYKGIIGYLVTFAVLFTAHYTFIYTRDYSYWFHYHDFYPTKASYELGEPLTFISEADIYRPVELEWKDVLRCKYDDVFQYTSVYYSSNVYQEPREYSPKDPQYWVWQGKEPQRPTTCYVSSTACAIVDYGMKKCQQQSTEEQFKLK